MTAPTPYLSPEAQRGVTLLELVIAVFVLAIGTIAAMRGISYATRVVGGETPRILATEAALNRAEELRLLGATKGGTLPDQERLGPWEWHIEVQEERTRAGFVQATVLTTAKGQPGGRIVAIVPVERTQ